MIEGMRRADPPPIPQLAIPVEVVEAFFRFAQSQPSIRVKTIADLAIIAFYYLLRVGEYTKTKYTHINGQKVKASRTIQF